MRALVALALLGGVAFAQPPSKTKQAPDKFAKAASDAFVAAGEADAKGDLYTALAFYEKAYAISPHPSTIYNLADVQRRLSLLRQAIKSYETYLVMAPGAKDRADVEKVIDELAKTPGTLIVFTADARDRESLDLSAGYVLVSGEIKKPPGPVPVMKPRDRAEIHIKVPPGEHVVDFVTSITYATRECEVDPGGQRFCELKAEPRIDGNAVISAQNRRIDVNAESNRNDLVYKRIELPVGKHRLLVKDRSYRCAPLAIETTASANTVVYSFIGTNEYDGYKRCRTFAIKQHRLQFEP